MVISLGEILCVMILGAALVYWWKGQGLKEQALRATRQHCKHYDVQLLDESLVLSKVKLTRNEQGLPALGRLYQFEFTATGQERNGGTTSLVGNRVVSVQLDPYRFN